MIDCGLKILYRLNLHKQLFIITIVVLELFTFTTPIMPLTLLVLCSSSLSMLPLCFFITRPRASEEEQHGICKQRKLLAVNEQTITFTAIYNVIALTFIHYLTSTDANGMQ